MLRRQALAWLRTDLSAYAKLAQREEPAAKEMVRRQLGHWPEDADLLRSATRPHWTACPTTSARTGATCRTMSQRCSRRCRSISRRLPAQ